MEIVKAVIIAAIFQYVAGEENVCSSSCSGALGCVESCPGKSCNDIYQNNKATRGLSGYYWIKTTTGVH